MTAAPIAPSRPVELVLSRLDRVKRSGANWIARCPAHEDREPSLSIKEGRDGRVLLNCHAGCSFDAIVRALGLEPSDTFPPDSKKEVRHGPELSAPTSRPRLVKSYDYVDAEGQLLFQACRFVTEDGRKTFRQRRPDGAGNWTWSIADVEPVLYRLPEVLAAVESGRRVFVVEGEKDADTLAEAGYVATTNPMGAGKWREHYAEALRGAEVVVLPDNDDVGRSHAEQVAASLAAAGCVVRVVALPNVPEKGDVTDWLEAGGDFDTLEELIAKTPKYGAESSARRIEWRLDELFEDDEIMRPPPPVVPRIAWGGRSTLLSAREKAGKSTLAGYMAARVSRGYAFLGDRCQQGTVLIIGLEEFVGDTARRLRHFGADATRIVLRTGFLCDPRQRNQELQARIQALSPVLVIVDSLAAYSDGQIKDDNNASQMTSVMQPLTNVAHETGVALVILHHARKSDGRARGSTAITAGVDLCVEFVQDPEKETTDPTYREMRAIGRVPAPPRTAIRFTGEHYELADGSAAPLEHRIIEFVRSHPNCSQQSVLEAMGSRWDDTRKHIHQMLTTRTLVNTGTTERTKLIVPGPDFMTGGVRDDA